MENQCTPAFARPAEAAKHFGVCKTTLWRWAKREDFPKPARMGRKCVLFELSAVAHWIKSHGEAVE